MRVYIKNGKDWKDFEKGNTITAYTKFFPDYFKVTNIARNEMVSLSESLGLITIRKDYKNCN